MPHKNEKSQDFSKFDAMSSEELGEYLRADFQRSEEETNVDELLYISELLAARNIERDTDADAETERAWADFNQYYRSTEAGEEAARSVPFKPSVRRLLRVCAVAAVVTMFLFATTAIASAQGFDIWASISDWTMETFGFSFYKQPHRDDVTDTHLIPEQLMELEDYLEQYGVGKNLIPSYLPENTEVIGTTSFDFDEYVKIVCMLQTEEDSIIIQYFVFSEPFQGVEYQKDDVQPNIYKSNGIDFYITENVDKYQCVWTYENVQCSIVNITSKDTLIQIIDSVPGK